MRDARSVSHAHGLGLLLGAALVTGPVASAAAGATWSVANNGVDSPTCGTSRTNPCRSISQALANAGDGDTISVGAGRYGDLNGDGAFTLPGAEQPLPDPQHHQRQSVRHFLRRGNGRRRQ